MPDEVEKADIAYYEFERDWLRKEKEIKRK